MHSDFAVFMDEKKISVESRSRDEWVQDPNSYCLIRCNAEKNLLEVRIMDNERKVLQDYKGKTPEDLYYKIIKDGRITNLQHAAYLGSELRKAFIAMKLEKKFIQDEEI